MGIHIACGKKNPKKKGFSYFLCCGCGPEEDSKPVRKSNQSQDRPKGQPNYNLPSSVTGQPNVITRPTHPDYNITPPDKEGRISVADRRRQYEELVKAKQGGIPNPILPGTRPETNGTISAKAFFAKSLEGDEDDMREEAEKKYENRNSFTTIFGNAPLYQIYDAYFKHKESKRVRHRLRESIRSLRKKRGDARPPKAIVEPPKFGEDQSSTSSTSSDDESALKTPSSEKTSNFTVIRREDSRNHSGIERTAKVGEMNTVANEFSGSGPARVRWADMPEVVKQNLAAGLTKEQRSLQEARFEIITSEASYYRSLTVLIDLFYKAPVFNPSAPNAVITEFDKHQLFSNILNIHVTSENLLHSLELSFRKEPMMENICDILYEHSETKLSYYVTYVKNQMYQTRTLSKLLNRPAFKEAVQAIQSMPQCMALDLNSFLVLPMQRVMRLRLLVAAVIHYTPRNSRAYESGLCALASLEKLISECNSQKSHMEQKERLVTLSSQLEFKANIRAIGTGSRELIKEGNLRLLETSNLPNAAFRRKFADVIKNKPIQMTLFLFSDILLVAKRRGEKYLVEDICPVDDLSVTIEALPEEDSIKRTEFKTKANPDDPYYIVPNIRPSRSVSVRQTRDTSMQRQTSGHFRERSRSRGGSARHFHHPMMPGTPTSGGAACEQAQPFIGYPFILTFQSTNFAIVDYHFLCDTQSQRERWVDALQPGYYSVPPEISYDTWDCPQVIATVSYGSQERDELDVKEGDLMNVIVELSDGWLKGVLPDGRAGWVPSNVCQQVEDPQARRQNMKNFLLSEEAQRAYMERKEKEKLSNNMFARVHEVKNASKIPPIPSPRYRRT